MNKKNVWLSYDREQLKETEKFAERYKEFLNNSKTEREVVDSVVNEIEERGYRELGPLVRGGEKLKAGDKVYTVWMNKTIALFRIGTEPMEHGMNILCAHIDSPRLDVKQNPVYEDSNLCLLDTHYYGGIKKYLFVAIPMALHGIVARKDGSVVQLCVGEDEDDPVFFVSDLLVHLAAEQMSKKASEAIEGEALDLVVGSRPFVISCDDNEEDDASGLDDTLTAGQQSVINQEKNDKKEETRLSGAFKRGILAILKDTYGIAQEDLSSAELEIVPAGKARDAGFDRSMIMAHGQDDRVCAYPSVEALLDSAPSKRTSACLLVDKEEINSTGATGMQSHFFENAVAEVMNLTGDYNELKLRRCLADSCMLSSDVSAAVDPNYKSCFELKNAAFIGNGMVFNKYTGSRGKYNSNDANAEYIAHLRKIFDDNSIIRQTAELGKVDKGGGGTIACYAASYGMNVIDSGVAVLDMHAPWEVTSKADIYETYRGYIAFLENADFRNQNI